MNFKKIKLKDIIISANTGADAIQRAPIVDYNTGKKCLRIGDISNHREYENWGFTDVNDENYKKYKLEKDDILIARTGSTIGINKFVDRDLEAVYNNGLIRLRVNKEKYNSKYIYYNLQTSKFKNFIESIAFGTTGQPNMKINDLLTFKIEDIPLKMQNRLVDIIDKLDKKIQLNNQINNNLYEIIETYYKEKYIYNAEKNLCTMNELVKEIIAGDWGKEKLKDNYNKEVLCIRGADIPEMDKGNKGKAPNRFILEKNLNKKQLTGSEIVIEISGGSPTQSTGRCVYITPILEQSFELPLICTNFCKAIRLKDKKYLPSFYMNLKYLYNKNIMFLYENGTTGIKNLDLNSLVENEEINILSEDENKKFNSLFYSINSKMVKKSEENKKLKQLRDTLLPKLMNGEIDMGNI